MRLKWFPLQPVACSDRQSVYPADVFDLTRLDFIALYRSKIILSPQSGFSLMLHDIILPSKEILHVLENSMFNQQAGYSI